MFVCHTDSLLGCSCSWCNEPLMRTSHSSLNHKSRVSLGWFITITTTRCSFTEDADCIALDQQFYFIIRIYCHFVRLIEKKNFNKECSVNIT